MVADISGSWKLVKSDNVDGYMDATGKASSKDKMKKVTAAVKITQEGDHVTVAYSDGVDPVTFVPGQVTDVHAPDGTTYKCTPHWEGNKFVVKSGEHVVTREVVGGELHKHISSPSKGVHATQTFKKA